jgi:hypothetical protein
MSAFLSACTTEPATTSSADGAATTTATSTSAPATRQPSSVVSSPSTPSSSTPAPTPGPTSEPAEHVSWPPEAQAEHGGQYWAVYLAVAHAGTDQAELAAAHASAKSIGYQAGIGSICEAGATEALGLNPDISYDAVSIFFDTAAQAQEFVDLYQPGVVGTAFITAYCLD